MQKLVHFILRCEIIMIIVGAGENRRIREPEQRVKGTKGMYLKALYDFLSRPEAGLLRRPARSALANG